MKRKQKAPSAQKAQKRQHIDEIVEQAKRNGYLLTTPAVPQQAQDFYRHWCKQQREPIILVGVHGVYATLTIDISTAVKGWESAGMIPRGGRASQLVLTPGMAEQLSQWSAYYMQRSPARPESVHIGYQELILRHILAEDVDQAVREFLLLWAPARQEYEAQLEARRREPRTQIQAASPVEPAWKAALASASAGECPPAPSCDHVAIPGHLPALITKEQLCAFLGLPTRTGERKVTLVTQLLEAFHTDASTKARFFEIFVEEIAVEPWELEQLLECTTSERKRWVSDGKLVPFASRSVRKSGRDLIYPIFDRRDVAKLTPEIIAHFREEHASLVALRRKTGARVAQESRVKYAEARKRALQEIENTLGEWRQMGSPELAAVLQLAFWTQMASRWAKENQVKSLHATKHGALYRQRMDEWYQRKEEALRILVCSSYARISYYQPEDADKIELSLCENHYEEFREGYYDGKWDFYTSYRAQIHACPACWVNISHDYYALYAIEIAAPPYSTWTFSFHIPQPKGKSFLPPARALPRVLQVEQEGLFRFGRQLYAEEKILYREKDVAVHLARALAEASTVPGLTDR